MGATSPTFDNFDQETIQRTTDGGNSWTEIDAAGSGPLSAVVFRNKTSGWASGANGRLLKTDDGGLSWNNMNLPLSTPYSLKPVTVLGTSEVWVASTTHFFHSTNDGQIWTTSQLPDSSDIFGLYFLNSNIGWVVGDSGSIWKFDQLTSVKKQSPSETFVVHGSFPNPFNPVTSIAFSLPKSGMATLRIYNITGRLITTLSESFLPSGYHEISFDGRTLSSGTYLYVLSTDFGSYSGKMILSK